MKKAQNLKSIEISYITKNKFEQAVREIKSSCEISTQKGRSQSKIERIICGMKIL